MRKITDHRLDNGDFHDAFQRVVRNSPWWLLSAVAHGVALAILWSIPMPVNGKYTPVIQSSIADKPPEMDEIDVEPPEPVQKQEKIDEATGACSLGSTMPTMSILASSVTLRVNRLPLAKLGRDHAWSSNACRDASSS